LPPSGDSDISAALLRAVSLAVRLPAVQAQPGGFVHIIEQTWQVFPHAQDPLQIMQQPVDPSWQPAIRAAPMSSTSVARAQRAACATMT
jgi:hypothetical protein